MRTLLSMLLLLVFLTAFTVAGCGGGDSTTPTPPTTPTQGDNEGGNTYIPSNDMPPLNPGDSVPGYGGYVPPGLPTGDTVYPDPQESWIPSYPIFPLPVDSGGNGFLTVSSFQPGQQLALVTANVNRAYRDWHPTASQIQSFPPFSFSLVFSLVQRRSASALLPPEPAQGPQVEELNLSLDNYEGLPYTEERLPLNMLFEREYEYQKETTGYDVMAPLKTASILSKGEVRTFTEIPRTISLPPIQPGGDDQQELEDLRWPDNYYGQDGRLVAIGARCYIFLTTELNEGLPDGVRFTERRLAAFAQEFDTNIFPKVQAAFGDILGYHNEGPGTNDGPIWKDIDRDYVLTGDNFDRDGNLINPLPGEPDYAIGRDNRLVVAMMNLPAGAAGLYANWQRGINRPSITEEGGEVPEESYAWSTCYLDLNIFPANSDDWSQPYAVLSHEFQHKLNADHGLPDSIWLNEGLSQLAVYSAGYTLQSGRTAQILVDQVRTFLNNSSEIPVCLDAERVEGIDVFGSYGARFLFFLYLAEHYGPGTIHKLYTLGYNNPVELIEKATGEKFESIYTKWMLANFVDGAFVDPTTSAGSVLTETNNPWLHYLTFDIRSTVGMEEANRLPGMPVLRLPGETDTYPVTRSLIPLNPYCAQYTIIENGDGRDLDLTLFADPNFRFYLLPVSFNATTNKAEVVPGLSMPND